MKPSTVTKLAGIVGLGLTALGVALYYRERKNAALAGPRYNPGRFAEAPMVDSFSDGDATTVLRASDNMPIEQRIGSIQKMIEKSVMDPKMRALAMEITKDCPERDGKCEAKAIYKAVKKRVRYTGDVAPIKMSTGDTEGIDLYQSARRTWEMGGGDCLPLSTLVLRDDYKLVPIIELDPGDRIMGERDWTQVLDRWLTDIKPILEFELSNGCVLRCSPEHRIFRNVNGRVEEIRAYEARVGDDLIPADTVPVYGQRSRNWPDVVSQLSDDELAWLLGAFVADGWAEGKTNARGELNTYRASISGADGQIKEEQKRRVQAMMAKIGVPTYWHHKHIRINNSDLAKFFAEAGSPARNKHVPDLKFASQDEVRALLEGLSADADRRSGVFGTTSETLALQLRVIHRMLGQSVHIKRVNDHGGLGTHPIYRITPRAIDNDRRDIKFARVRSIREGIPELCADLTTEEGKFWLPESDVMAHNCDDQVALVATLASVIGLTTKLRVTAECADCEDGHIYPIVLLPKFSPEYAVAVDTTLPGSYNFGTEAPAGRVNDYDA